MLDIPIASGPPKASKILWPGMPVLPDNVERYLVEGGESAVVPIEAGDQIRVVFIRRDHAFAVDHEGPAERHIRAGENRVDGVLDRFGEDPTRLVPDGDALCVHDTCSAKVF